MESLELLKNGKAKFWNIIVGVNNYRGGYQNLAFARESAYKVLSSLDKAQEKFGKRQFFLHTDEDSCRDKVPARTWQNASLEAVVKTLTYVQAQTMVTPDIITFFFFGHGVISPTGQMMLCLSDTEEETLKNALPVAELFKLLKDAGNSRLLVINACRILQQPEALKQPKNDNLGKLVDEHPKFQLLLSCQFNQTSLDHEVKSRQDFITGIRNEIVYPNPFAEALIDGLEGRGRSKITGIITLESLSEYIQTSMRNHCDQNPQLLLGRQPSRPVIVGYAPEAHRWDDTTRYFTYLNRIIEYKFPLLDGQIQELHGLLDKDFGLTLESVQVSENLLFNRANVILKEIQNQSYVFLQDHHELKLSNLRHFFHAPIQIPTKYAAQDFPFGKSLTQEIRRDCLAIHCSLRKKISAKFIEYLSQSSSYLAIDQGDINNFIPHYLEIAQQQTDAYQLEPFGQTLILYLWNQAFQDYQAICGAYRDRLIQAKYQGLPSIDLSEESLSTPVRMQIQQTVEHDWQTLQDFLANYRGQVRQHLIRRWLSSSSLELLPSDQEFLEAFQVAQNLAISIQADLLQAIQADEVQSFKVDMNSCTMEFKDLAQDVYPILPERRNRVRGKWHSLNATVVERLFESVDSLYQARFDELSAKLATIIHRYYGQDEFSQKYEEFENFAPQELNLSRTTVKILYKKYEKYDASVRSCIENGYPMSSTSNPLELDAGALSRIRQKVEQDIREARLWEYLQDEMLQSD
jgi:hypothetical protein